VEVHSFYTILRTSIEPIPVRYIPPKPNAIEEVTATYPRLYLAADANWKVQLMWQFHNGENWWGSTVVVAVLVLLLHPIHHR
jgi:hypothetical protein